MLMSQSFLCISVIFLQKAIVQYISFTYVRLYLLKVYQFLYTSARNQVTHFGFFGTFSHKWSEIDLILMVIILNFS